MDFSAGGGEQEWDVEFGAVQFLGAVGEGCADVEELAAEGAQAGDVGCVVRLEGKQHDQPRVGHLRVPVEVSPPVAPVNSCHSRKSWPESASVIGPSSNAVIEPSARR
ncbi:hypothetical protein ACWED2_11225 [Amycolatopsis sp. NPDC005003]